MNIAPAPIFYGRQKGRPLCSTNQRLIETLWPKVTIDLPDKAVSLDPSSLFPHSPSQIVLEIGFGGGEHLAHQARISPHTGFIGCEPFLNGVASLLQHMEKNNLQNIRIFKGDARLFIEMLPKASVNQIFLLFPDPWPKARHNKRRFISQDSLNQLARILKPRGSLQLATDHGGYFEWMIDHLSQHPNFQWQNPNPQEWEVEPEVWIQTRYQQKALSQGRSARFLKYLFWPSSC